ncbi:fumarylacetoacetate hydrolase family protein [Candidatus Auribacterota bacterium]
MIRTVHYSIILAIAWLYCSGCAMVASHPSGPQPAQFNCLATGKDDGQLVPLVLHPKHIYGMGLTYAKHIVETGSEYDPKTTPPVFIKSLVSLNQDLLPVKVPLRKDLIACAEKTESGLGSIIEKKYENLPPLLDYEGELAFVLLENVDWGRIKDSSYAPKIGYFIANDISARSLAILGEGRDNKYDYWGASKSFKGFLPVGKYMWIPREHIPDSILNVVIITKVNGEIRQKSSTTDIIYTPRQMLEFIGRSFPNRLPAKGDVVLTGTPGGVAMQVSGTKKWLADVLGFDRFTKLNFMLKDAKKNKKFLQPGDIVTVSVGILGELKTEIVE